MKAVLVPLSFKNNLNMETMIILLTILGCAIFLIGAYYMGNFVMSSFSDSFQTRIVHTAYGILCWGLLGIVGLIFYGIYSLVDFIV
jgi:hypothetical protein